MVSNDIIEDIKSRLDIVDIASEYIDLKNAGANFKALCPFHSEKTPSFMVSPQKQIFHCFGCGVGGDIFSFVMRYENVSFSEALNTLAKRAGIQIKSERGKQPGTDMESLYRLHNDAALFYVEQRDKNRDVRKYFVERGLKEQTIESFKLGYAPARADSLYRYLKKQGYDRKTMESSGIIKFPEGRSPYDMFRDRIIFPIVDLSERIIAFGARILHPSKDSAMPKYINSPETSIFKKGQMLYGLNLGKQHIRKKGYALISEGYTDVILCHQYGFKNAVAPLGTSLTGGHAKRLRAHAKKVLLVFDGDEAGQKAARRTLPIVYQNGLRAKILLLPDGHDPDSYLREKGAHEFQKLFPRSKDIVDFFMGLEEDRVDLINEISLIISKIADPILRGQLAAEVSQKTQTPETHLLEKIKGVTRLVKAGESPKQERKAISPEETLMAIAFTKPAYAQQIIDKLSEGDIEKNILKGIFLKVQERGAVPTLGNIRSFCNEEELEYISLLTINPGFDEEELGRTIDDCFIKLRERALQTKSKDIELRIRHAESIGDQVTIDSLVLELRNIKKTINPSGGTV